MTTTFDHPHSHTVFATMIDLLAEADLGDTALVKAAAAELLPAGAAVPDRWILIAQEAGLEFLENQRAAFEMVADAEAEARAGGWDPRDEATDYEMGPPCS